jgi:hypothetical protein
MEGRSGIRGLAPLAQNSAQADAKDGALLGAMLLKRKAEAAYGIDSTWAL